MAIDVAGHVTVRWSPICSGRRISSRKYPGSTVNGEAASTTANTPAYMRTTPIIRMGTVGALLGPARPLCAEEADNRRAVPGVLE
jgi:hypothetical protein